ncbi:MAG TPA: NAD(P)-dependent oxidoreductase [Roseovarius sp.]
MSIQTPLFRTAAGDHALEITRDFFHEHDVAMLNAAAMLGGPTAHRRCLRLLVSVAESVVLSKALKHELVWLHRLIMLEFVGDPEREETARFAVLDILDPRVEEICLQADQLYELLVAIADEDPTCDIVQKEVFDLSAA